MKNVTKGSFLIGLALFVCTMPVYGIKSEEEIRSDIKNYPAWFFTNQDKLLQSISDIDAFVQAKSGGVAVLNQAWVEGKSAASRLVVIINQYLLTSALVALKPELEALKISLEEHRAKLKKFTSVWEGRTKCRQILYDFAGVLIVTVIDRLIHDADIAIEWREREVVIAETKQVLHDIDSRSPATDKKYLELEGIEGENKRKRYSEYAKYYALRDRAQAKKDLINDTNAYYGF